MAKVQNNLGVVITHLLCISCFVFLTDVSLHVAQTIVCYLRAIWMGDFDIPDPTTYFWIP